MGPNRQGRPFKKWEDVLRNDKSFKNSTHQLTRYHPFTYIQIKYSSKSVNINNLICIDTSLASVHTSSYFSVSYLNAQSARNKTLLLCDWILESGCDITFITESWFYKEGDEVLIAELTPPGFTPIHVPRLTGPGGGLCVLHKEALCVTSTVIHDFKSFEACEFKVTSAGKLTTNT